METNVLQSLGASRGPDQLTRSLWSPTRLQLHNNLGMRAAFRKRSQDSLQDASFRTRAQRQAEIHPATIGMDPASRKRSLSKRTLPGHFALGEQAGQLTQKVPPSPQLDQLDLDQLRADIAHLKEMMQELAGKSFSKRMAATTPTTTTTTT